MILYLSIYDYTPETILDKDLYKNLHTANYNAKKQVLKASYPTEIEKRNNTMSEFPMSKKDNCFSKNSEKPSSSPRKPNSHMLDFKKDPKNKEFRQTYGGIGSA